MSDQQAMTESILWSAGDRKGLGTRLQAVAASESKYAIFLRTKSPVELGDVGIVVKGVSLTRKEALGLAVVLIQRANDIPEKCEVVYNRTDFPLGCPMCGKEH